MIKTLTHTQIYKERDNKMAEYLFRRDINKHNNNTHHKINRLVKVALNIFILISQALRQRPRDRFL